jgi:hypothetical protein
LSEDKSDGGSRPSSFYWLSDADVSAATRLLALLARGEGAAPAARQSRIALEPQDLAGYALALRKRRIALLGDMFAAEPPFAILLALYSSRTRAGARSATELTEAVCLPPSTALRWLGPMATAGWIARARGSDARKARISLTEKATDALDQLFGSIP